MNWLVGAVITSAAGAFIAVRAFDHLKDEAASGVANAARAGLFLGTWTAITAGAGMHEFNKRVGELRRRIVPPQESEDEASEDAEGRNHAD